MSETRMMQEVEKMEELELTKDMLKTLLTVEKVMNREDISENEKKRFADEIIDNKLDELRKRIAGKQSGNGWDFSKEKEKDIFSEDEIIDLIGYREEDNNFIWKIKKES